MSLQPTTYFRTSTIKKHEIISQKPFEPKGRKILPLNETPSLTMTSSLPQIDPEISGIKAAHRIHCYFIQAIVEITLNTQLNRGKTSLQGTSAPKGWQAGHGSFFPTTNDNKMVSIVDHVAKNGVTATETLPLLQQRIGLSDQEINVLNQARNNPQFIRDFLESLLPKNGMHSILSDTRFHWNSNATFENPDESNRFDSKLEKEIAPFLKALQRERVEQKASAEESTEKLVKWLINYYQKSQTNTKSQLEHLSQLSEDLKQMRTFEQKYTHHKPPKAEFDAYLKAVSSFLENHKAILEKKMGCPSLKELKFIRNDISFLTNLSKKSSDTNESFAYFQNNSHHLHKTTRNNSTQKSPVDLTKFERSCSFHYEEAMAQSKDIEVFEDACSIPDLLKLHFGIVENGIRRAPNDEELVKQVYALTKLATPVKKAMTERRASPEHLAKLNKLKRTLNFNNTHITI